MSLRRFLIVAAVTVSLFASFGIAEAAAAERLIQVAVEVVEVNEGRALDYGVRWNDVISVQEGLEPAGEWQTAQSGWQAPRGWKSVFTLADPTRSRLFATVKLLLDKNAAELLANPKVVVRDGQTAKFEAGGEIPYIVSGGQGQVSVEFKPYGVILEIRPQITAAGNIQLPVTAEVSSLDATVAVELAGNKVPGILKRRVQSDVTLSPGATLTIAGLLQTRKEKGKIGIPILSEIPGLGALFSHNTTRNLKTNIVIFITPTLQEQK